MFLCFLRGIALRRKENGTRFPLQGFSPSFLLSLCLVSLLQKQTLVHGEGDVMSVSILASFICDS
jgi:hypothetical protein